MSLFPYENCSELPRRWQTFLASAAYALSAFLWRGGVR